MIVPIRNMAGKFRNLEIWLPSAIEQNMQVILVEDLYDALTTKQLNSIVAKFGTHIQVVRGEFGSPGAARNAGLKLASGDWVIFWDSDDIGYPNNVSEVLQSIEEKSELIVTSFSVKNWESNSLLETNLIKSQSGKLLDIAERPGLWRILINKDLLRLIRFLPISMAEDQIFIAELNLLNPHIEYRNEICYTYFKGVPNQLTSNQDKMRDLKISTEYLSGLIKLHPNDELVKEFYVRQIVTAIKHGEIKIKVALTLRLINTILVFPRLKGLAILMKIAFKP